MKVFIYTRYSTDKQGDSSTETQLRTCREYAAKHGLTVSGEFSDDGVSSGIPMTHRPQGARLVASLTRGSVLLVMHTDRLARSERKDDGLRMFVESTEQALERIDEALRIVSQELWEAVKARQARQSAAAGAKVKAGLQKKARKGDCGKRRYLLTGLLRCGECGQRFQMTNARRYQCASHHQGGAAACGVGLSVLRDRLEQRVMERIEFELLAPGRLADLEQRLRSSAPIVVDNAPRIAELAQREKNLAVAIATGGDMSALLAALKAAQTEREKLERVARNGAITPVLPSLDSYEDRVRELKKKLAQGGDVARAAVAEITGGAIMLDLDDSGRFFWAIFEDGVRAALLADAELMGVAYSDPRVFGLAEGKVESSGSGGRI